MKPQIVRDWERSVETIEQMCPQCCYTCCNELEGKCTKYGNEIPREFMEKIDGCEAWSRSPF